MPRESTDALLGLHEWKGAGLSAQDVRERPHDYAVVWRTGDGPTSAARRVGDDQLAWRDPIPDRPGPLRRAHVGEIGRGMLRFSGEDAVRAPSCERVLVAALGGMGLLGELTTWARCSRAGGRAGVVGVPIRRGTARSPSNSLEGPRFTSGFGIERTTLRQPRARCLIIRRRESNRGGRALSRARVRKAAVRWRGIAQAAELAESASVTPELKSRGRFSRGQASEPRPITIARALTRSLAGRASDGRSSSTTGRGWSVSVSASLRLDRVARERAG